MADPPSGDVFLDLAACLEAAGETQAADEAFGLAEDPPDGSARGRALREMEESIPPGAAHAWKCLTVAKGRIMGRRPAVLARARSLRPR